MVGMKKYLNRKLLHIVFAEIFAIFLVAYLLLFLLEWLSPAFVRFYFEADIVLWTVIISSLGYFITSKK